jgi:hypothetical protein
MSLFPIFLTSLLIELYFYFILRYISYFDFPLNLPSLRFEDD